VKSRIGVELDRVRGSGAMTTKTANPTNAHHAMLSGPRT
jgi:hypothetical protein